jgi:hypothetical protein
MKKNEENKRKKSSIRRIIEAGIVLGGVLLVCALQRKNKKLTQKCYNYEGQIENQKDVIRGLHKIVERSAFRDGKISRKFD